jgi:hypothetical protein
MKRITLDGLAYIIVKICQSFQKLLLRSDPKTADNVAPNLSAFYE